MGWIRDPVKTCVWSWIQGSKSTGSRIRIRNIFHLLKAWNALTNKWTFHNFFREISERLICVHEKCSFIFLIAVLWICYGSGAGSTDPYHWHLDPEPDPALLVRNLQDAIIFFFNYLLNFKGFLTYWMIEGSGSGTDNDGFGSGRSRNIRTRIHKTAENLYIKKLVLGKTMRQKPE